MWRDLIQTIGSVLKVMRPNSKHEVNLLNINYTEVIFN